MTVVPSIAATYYVWGRLRALPQSGTLDGAIDENFGRLISYAAAVLGGLLARFEFGPEGAVLPWCAGMTMLLTGGHLLRDADLRLQTYAGAAALFVWLVVTTSEAPSQSAPSFCRCRRFSSR